MGDNLPAVPLGANRLASKVSAGTGRTCVLLTTGDLVCQGACLFQGAQVTEGVESLMDMTMKSRAEP